MEISQTGLLYLFFCSAFVGIALGGLYDVFRVIKTVFFAEMTDKSEGYRRVVLPLVKRTAYFENDRKIKKSIYFIYTFISDLLFSVICAVAAVLAAYAYNSGRMRWLIFVGMLSGFSAYYLTVGKLILKISALAAFLLRSAAVYVYFFISAPIKALIRTIKNRRSKWKIKRRSKDIPPHASEA